EGLMFESTHIDDTMVACFSPGPISNDEWTRFMHEQRKKPITKFIGGVIGVVEVNSLQRKESTSYVATNHVKVIAITDDKVVRGLATAASWVGVNIDAFSWKDLREAVACAGFEGEKLIEVMNTLLFFRRSLERASLTIKRVG